MRNPVLRVNFWESVSQSSSSKQVKINQQDNQYVSQSATSQSVSTSDSLGCPCEPDPKILFELCLNRRLVTHRSSPVGRTCYSLQPVANPVQRMNKYWTRDLSILSPTPYPLGHVDYSKERKGQYRKCEKALFGFENVYRIGISDHKLKSILLHFCKQMSINQQ